MAETTDTLTHLLDQVEAATHTPPVTVASVLHAIGERSFAPIILVVAILMVSPLSGIPGAPTLSALMILIVGIQSLIGRNHLWLPDFILRRTIPEHRLATAVSWLRRPAAWFDRHSHQRWPFLTMPPLRWVTMLACVLIPSVWPFLELLPFVTSLGAGAVSLLAFGLITRDGLYVLLGFAFVAGMVGMVVRFVGAG